MIVRVVTLTALGLAGCGFQISATAIDAAPGGDAVDAADRDPDAAIDGAPGIGPWSTPVIVTIPGSLGGDDDPTLTDDRLEMYFNRLLDIYVTRRASVSAAWGTPMLVTELSNPNAIETTPEISSDGLTIFIGSDRPGSSGGSGDIWMSTRPNRTAAWGAPINVASANSNSNDSAGTVTDDHLAMVLNSTRDQTFADLYIATRATVNVAWSTPVAVTPLETSFSDFSPILSQDKLRVYWDSDGGSGSDDLYTATRLSTSATFGTPQNIAELNSPLVEADPWVSADGHHIVFVSNRSGIYEMYEASR